MKTRDEIAKAWSVLTHNDGFTKNNDVLNAMQDYADEATKDLKFQIDLKNKEIESLKERVIFWNEAHDDLIEQLTKQT